MPRPARNLLPLHTTQAGAALVVSLILLLVMTIMGVATMRSSVLEVRMAGSAQQQEDALRDAERTLAAAEDQIDLWSSDGAYTPEGAGFYRATTPAVRQADWSGVTTAAGPATADPNRTTVVNNFVVEYLGTRVLAGESISEGRGATTAGSQIYMFRPVARSAQSSRAVRIVESLYATASNP